jgi:hypothetical protein
LAETIAIKLTAVELEKLMRPVTPGGGQQRCLLKMQSKVAGDQILVTDDDLTTSLRYGRGQEGWQDRIAPIVRVATQRFLSNADRADRR